MTDIFLIFIIFIIGLVSFTFEVSEDFEVFEDFENLEDQEDFFELQKNKKNIFSGPSEGVRRGTITNVDNLMNKYDAAEMIKKELGDDVEENHVHQFILVMQLR